MAALGLVERLGLVADAALLERLLRLRRGLGLRAAFGCGSFGSDGLKDGRVDNEGVPGARLVLARLHVTGDLLHVALLMPELHLLCQSDQYCLLLCKVGNFKVTDCVLFVTKEALKHFFYEFINLRVLAHLVLSKGHLESAKRLRIVQT